MDLTSDSGFSWCRELYEAHATEWLLYGRALGLGHAEAQDVLQDSFVALLALREKPANPRHYGLRTFRNRALNYRRGLFRRLARELESKRWFESSEEVSPQELAAQKCLEGLPRDQREVIVLKIWHQMTYDEIGQLLEISSNTAAGRYRYGLEKLRTCLGETNYEPGPHVPFGNPAEILEAATPIR